MPLEAEKQASRFGKYKRGASVRIWKGPERFAEVPAGLVSGAGMAAEPSFNKSFQADTGFQKNNLTVQTS